MEPLDIGWPRRRAAARACGAGRAVARARRRDPRRSHRRAALPFVGLPPRHRCPGTGRAEPRAVRGPAVARGGPREPGDRARGGPRARSHGRILRSLGRRRGDARSRRDPRVPLAPAADCRRGRRATIAPGRVCRDRARGLGGDGAAGARAGAGGAGARLRAGGPRARRVRRAARGAARPPQRARARHRRRDPGGRGRDHGRSGPLVRGPGCAAADAVLGRHDRRGTGSAARCAVGVALPGARDRRHGAGCQSRGRRLARRARRAGMTDIAYHPTRLRALRDQFRALRAAEFPWTADTVYLNNASIGPIPERTRRALDEFTAKRTAPHLLPDRELQAGLQAARVAVARLINAESSEIALTTNTSFGLNVAARALPLQRGDVVLVSDREFPANVYPWLLLKKQGVDVELAPCAPEGWPDEDYLVERLHDPRVRVLALSFVQFSNGYRADLARLGAACRANGTFLVVDGIQGVGNSVLDVRETPVDILACGGQKWLLAPWGSGFVYVRRELISVLEPPVTGWMAFEGTDDFSRLTEYNPTFRSDARRFEMVTLPFQDFHGMTASVGMLAELGIDDIAQYARTLHEPVCRWADETGVRVVSPRAEAHRSAIICLAPAHPVEAYHALKRAHVVCSLREGAIRLAPHCYNTVEELERVLDVLDQVDPL